MKYKLTKTQQLKQTYTFNTRLSNSLDVLKYSNDELLKTIFAAMKENPLLELNYKEHFSPILSEYYEKAEDKKDLKSHLLFQLNSSVHNMSQKICTFIIESLDKDGFFSEEINDSCKYLGVPPQEFEKNLSFIQTFQPVGVAQRNQIEAIIYQSEQLGSRYARNIMVEYANLMIKNNLIAIANNLHISIDEVKKEICVIRSTNPFPCSEYVVEKEEIILPDLYIE